MSQDNTQAALDAGQKLGHELGRVRIIDDNIYRNVPFALIGKDGQIWPCSLIEYQRKEPFALKRAVTFHDAASFAGYFNTFQTPHSRIYAQAAEAKFIGVIDDHQAAGDLPDDQPRPSNTCPDWCDHRAVLQLTRTEEWKSWTESNEKVLSQEEFMEFVEAHARDIAKPSGAAMLECVSRLDSTKTATFHSSARLDNGQRQFSYIENIKNEAHEGMLAIPGEIELAIEAFEGAGKYKVIARFRHRISHGKLTMWYSLLCPGRFERELFDIIVSQVADLTGTGVLMGVINK